MMKLMLGAPWLLVLRPGSAFASWRSQATLDAPQPGRPISLADVSSSSGQHSRHASAAAVEISKSGEVQPQPAGWFGDFAQMESTYDVSGEDAYTSDNSARLVKHGVDMGFDSPFGPSNVQKASWFHESESGGPSAAWQSHYPALTKTIGAREVADNKWRDTPEGWVQDYEPSMWGITGSNMGVKAADWFDSAVKNIGAYGRHMVPDKDDPRYLLATDGEAWVERSVNSSIRCAEVGCTASVVLVPFNAAKEEASNCRLSAKVHPTDFDNDHSDEYSNSWQVNGYVFRDRCDPMESGCSPDVAKALYNCVEDLDVDHLIDPAVGKLEVKATLSEMVDECPYNGNLLDGVVYATCMVRSTTTTTTTTTTVAPEEEVLLYGYGTSGPLRCKKPGCSAELELYIDPNLVLLGGKCRMNVTVQQTDYDEGQGVVEEVTHVWLSGGAGNISKNAKPGKNPCQSELQGYPLTDAEKTFSLVHEMDVSEEVLLEPLGVLELKGAISLHVDECATSGGYLFDGWVSVFCDPPPNATEAASLLASRRH